jgi:hypothetical protein
MLLLTKEMGPGASRGADQGRARAGGRVARQFTRRQPSWNCWGRISMGFFLYILNSQGHAL